MPHYTPLLSLLATLMMLFFFTKKQIGSFFQDIPNERSLHNMPVPRIGGIELIAGTHQQRKLAIQVCNAIKGTRYFMSIPEAAQLVLQAGLMGKGGEIFVLDMREPVKIVYFSIDMIRLSGLTEDDIKTEFVGLRTGEKLYEELLAGSEHTLPTPHPKLRIAQAREADAAWLTELLSWVQAATKPDEEVRAALKQLLPEYQPNSGGG